MKISPMPVLVTTAGLFAVLGAAALAAAQQGAKPPMMAHGKPVPANMMPAHGANVPNELPMSDVKGYQGWAVVAVHQTDERLKLIVANPVMMSAYRKGLPAKGQKFPEGSKIVKIEWSRVKDPVAPFPVTYQGKLAEVGFIEKDSKRFPKTNGWGYSDNLYDPATKTLKSSGKGPDCGHACHQIVAAQDFIFSNRPDQPPP